MAADKAGFVQLHSSGFGVNIFVCLKMVKDADGKPVMDASGSYALEEALRQKDCLGARVTAFCLGPVEAGPVLIRALAMGADEARHIAFNGQVQPSGLVLARALACAVRMEPEKAGAFDLILCGAASEDNGSGRTGPMLAGLLDLSLAGCVVELSHYPQKGVVLVTREVESGRRLVLELDLPALLTIQTTTRQPRYPSLSNLLRANRATVPAIAFDSLPEVGPTETLLSEEAPCAVSRVEMLSGSTAEKAALLFKMLGDRGFL